MANLKDKLKLAAESAKAIASNLVQGKDLIVSEKVFKDRMLTCQGCPKYNKLLNQCEECGCFLALKGRLANLKCPLGKWKV